MFDSDVERWTEEKFNAETDTPPADHHHQDDEDPEDLPALEED